MSGIRSAVQTGRDSDLIAGWAYVLVHLPYHEQAVQEVVSKTVVR